MSNDSEDRSLTTEIQENTNTVTMMCYSILKSLDLSRRTYTVQALAAVSKGLNNSCTRSSSANNRLPILSIVISYVMCYACYEDPATLLDTLDISNFTCLNLSLY
jgi:hypothetical protein